MLRRLREFFHDRGFLEVETPILSHDTVVDRHLDPFAVPLPGSEFVVPASAGSPDKPVATREPAKAGTTNYWLQTSPEFGMKRLLAAGLEAIYQVSRVFRQGERGRLHNPEFTLVEWYRVGDSYEQGMQFTSDLCEVLLADYVKSHESGLPLPPGEGRGEGACAVEPSGRPVSSRSTLTPCPSPGHPQRGSWRGEFAAERLTYQEAFRRHVGLDPHTAPIEDLMAAARECDSPPPSSLPPEDRDGWLDWLLSERVQPHLGVDRPTLLCDYPASQAALAQVRPGDPPVAERFELYVAGIELANGYHELLDPAELRRRNVRANAQRIADGKRPLPEESRLLAAMDVGLPPAVGVALGFDRLAMLAAGADSVAEVIAFPFDRA
jgi:elongation factor P--(R)-beta-lysine ligase